MAAVVIVTEVMIYKYFLYKYTQHSCIIKKIVPRIVFIWAFCYPCFFSFSGVYQRYLNLWYYSLLHKTQPKQKI